MDHKDLDVWKMSMGFVTNVYKLSERIPTSELYGLTSQIRRSAVSIPSNISEGAARKGDKEFLQFLYISLGSVAEIETQLIIAVNVNYLAKEPVDELLKELEEIKKRILGLIKYLKGKSVRGMR